MALTLEQFGLERLTPQQRFELIGLLWDSLPDEAPFAPPNWHLRELERRITAKDADPGAAAPEKLPEWCNVYEGLTGKQLAEVEEIVQQRADLTRPS